MAFQLDPDTLTALADPETLRHFSQGTAFQQSMNLLVMIDRMLEKDQKESLEALNLPAEAHQQALTKLDAIRKTFLRLNPPPDIDPEALRLYCD